jgi:hypothetical protein
MSDSDGSKEFNPQKMVEERNSSDITETVIKKAFSRVGLSYLMVFILSIITFTFIGVLLAEALFPLPELPVGPGEQGFKTAKEIDNRYRNHSTVRILFSTVGLFIGPLLWYGIRRYTDYEL